MKGRKRGEGLKTNKDMAVGFVCLCLVFHLAPGIENNQLQLETLLLITLIPLCLPSSIPKCIPALQPQWLNVSLFSCVHVCARAEYRDVVTFQVPFVAGGCCETPIKDSTSSVTDQPFGAGGGVYVGVGGEKRASESQREGWRRREREKIKTWVGRDDAKRQGLLNCRWHWKNGAHGAPFLVLFNTK